MSPRAAMASQASTTIAVSATVNKSCTISATGLAFAAYQDAQTSTDTGTATLSIICTNTTPYTVALDKGTTTGGTVSARLMTNGTTTLAYDLYTTAAATTVWGDGTTGTSTESGTGSGATQTLTVYGQIAAGLDPAPGSYTDTVTATVTY